MDPDIIYIKSCNGEIYIANFPWATALKLRNAGLQSSIDSAEAASCDNRTSFKLTSIDTDGRSPTEVEAWSKVLEHSTSQARVRAVQMHMN